MLEEGEGEEERQEGVGIPPVEFTLVCRVEEGGANDAVLVGCFCRHEGGGGETMSPMTPPEERVKHQRV